VTKERITELIDEVGLVGKERHRHSQLGAGEQQRAAIARPLANKAAACSDGRTDRELGPEYFEGNHGNSSRVSSKRMA